MSKVTIQCNPKKGGCGAIYEIEADRVNEDYIQCPFCMRIVPNPLK